MTWMVYVLCSSVRNLTYVGITTDIDRRLQQHNGELPGGARSTGTGRPWTVGATYGPYEDRGRAQSVEYQVKRRRGADRLDWTESAET